MIILNKDDKFFEYLKKKAKMKKLKYLGMDKKADVHF